MNFRTSIMLIMAMMLIVPTFIFQAGANEQEERFYSETAQLTGHFTENLGQWDDGISFIGDTPGGHLALGPGTAYLDLLDYDENGEDINGGHVIASRFIGSSGCQPSGSDELPHKNNYFLGNDPQKWASGASNYRKITYSDLWEDIGLCYVLTSSGPKYEFHLSPGSDPSDIRIRMDGIEELEARGDVLRIIATEDLIIEDTGLVAYYAEDMSMIDTSFKVFNDNTYGFDLDEYDESRSIVIDPYLKFTFIGGAGGDRGYTFTFDENGNTYAAGTTTSWTNFPITPGAYDDTYNGGFSGDIYITKINSSFQTLDYSTFIGGTGSDSPGGIRVRNGEAVFTGTTNSTDYPITQNAYNDTNVGWQTMFVTKLNRSGGSLEFSTLVDGEANESGSAVEYDDQGNVLVIGSTSSSDFPTTQGAYDTTLNSTTGTLADTDGVILKLNSQGTGLIFSTFYGGIGGDQATLVKVEEDGGIIITGNTRSSDLPITSGAYDPTLSGSVDLFFARFNHNASKLERSTFFGGGSWDYTGGAGVLPDGDIITAGYTYGSITTTAGAYDTTRNGEIDSFLARLDRNFTTLKAATYIGGSGDEIFPRMSVGPEGNVFIYGSTETADFPTTIGADDTTFNGTSNLNLYLAKLDGNLTTLMYSTFLGGDGYDNQGGVKAISPYKVMLTGLTSSTDFKVQGIGYDHIKDNGGDAFLLELSLLAPPTKPQNLTHTRGDDWVHLSWELPLSDGGSQITSYEVYKLDRLSALPSGPIATLPPVTFEYNDTTIEVDEEWYYYVKATNIIGPSPRSNWVRIADDTPPWLGLDLTPSTTVSAGILTFSTQVFDNAFVDSVWIEYHLNLVGDTGYFNTTMTDNGDGTFEYTIQLPDEVFTIDYMFSLNDTSDNWLTGPLTEVKVIGNIYPVFGADNTQAEVKAGDPLKFSIEAWDNVGIDDVTVEFWSERIYKQNVSMDNVAGNIFEHTFKTKRYSLAPIHYRFHAVDPAGHWNSTEEFVLDLLDAESPTIAADNTPMEATTSDPFTFSIQVSDNQEVSTVWVEYSINEEHYNETLINDYGNFYDLEITIPDEIGRISYRFFALDSNDNLGWVPAKNILIRDDDVPQIGRDLTNETAGCGSVFQFSVDASDNVAIDRVVIEYWFGEGAHFKENMDGENNYTLDIFIPDSQINDIAYFFKAVDTSGNFVETDVVKVTVKDLIPPSLVSDMTSDTVGTGSEIELKVKAVDNIGMKRIICIWEMAGVIPTELYLDFSEGIFTGSISVPEDKVLSISYGLALVDNSGNRIDIDARSVEVFDTIAPTIEEVLDLQVGPNTELNIQISAMDNIALETIELEGSPIPLLGNTIKGVIDEPGKYHIRAIAADTSGNTAEITFTITVAGESEFDDAGEKELTFGMFILPIISLIILIIVIVLFFILRNKDEEQEMPPLPPELTGETPQSGPDDELERLFQSSYNGEH